VPRVPIGEEEFRLWGPVKPGVARLWLRYYPDESPLYFVHLLRQYLRRGHLALDVGAGSGRLFRHGLRGSVKGLFGIDPDERIAENDQIHAGVVGVAERMPFRDGSFDVVFGRFVVEHLLDPLGATCEVARVLRPGGRFLVLAPNRNHYSALGSRLTSMWFHRAYMRLLGTRPAAADVHVAHYRMNSKRDIQRICREAGLEIERLEFKRSPPGYLRFHPLAFLLGTSYERVVEKTLSAARPGIVLVARKPSPPKSQRTASFDS